MTQASEQFKQAAKDLFDKILYLWGNSNNVWRNAWVMDTLLDYFTVCHVKPSPAEETAALKALNPIPLGNWWDDFGWIGIASLRAAEQNVFEHSNDFLKIAINAWAYMYGPGWSKSKTAIYPFTSADLPGWQDFEASHTPNVGAPNVWADIAQTWTDKPITNDQKMERKPRYSLGGAWNSTITGMNAPVLSPSYKASDNNLAPIQNTVTNGLYAILTLRIYQASQNSTFKDVFAESTLDTNACLQAWKDQVEWFSQWMLNTTPSDQSLLMELMPGSGALVRERVSTFDMWGDSRCWDAAYRKDLAWTGDQGLLLGVLREGQAAGYVQSDVFELYPDIVNGVFKNGYHQRTYRHTITGGDTVTGNFLLPWMKIGASDPYNAESPGDDTSDYQTGTGVFMRYLLQAYKAEPALVQKYKALIIDSANNIIRPGFGMNPQPEGDCDAFTPSGNCVDQMTAYINRLSVLLLAIAMGD